MAVTMSVSQWLASLPTVLHADVRECWTDMDVTLPWPKHWQWTTARCQEIQGHVTALWQESGGGDAQVRVTFEEKEKQVRLCIDCSSSLQSY